MPGVVRAVLGPTNTGKTHYAVERLLAHPTGVMGFPLRLLAREVYDRVVALKGHKVAALITGEERIVPEGARYFLCTAEAMPRHKAVDFVALDEVQMAADPERGHVFTEHLLHTRGRHETLLLGSETMRGVIQRLIPDVEVMTRPRMSELTYIKPARLSRLPRRSAVVGFSASDVYGMAELLRRSRGGTAIVMGALSPRTRNAQVEMYQSGEVEYLVATDAIGMGLNMDIHHVAFAGLSKFDGRTFRDLNAAEAAQIAGRAGRHTRDGTFSTLSGGDPIDPLMVSQIEAHEFEPVKKLVWRNPRLDFFSVGRLIRSLEMRTDDRDLHRLRDAADVTALKALAADPEIVDLARHRPDVEKLWQVAQIPDFRKLSPAEHHGLMARLYKDLMSGPGVISEDLINRQVKRLDNTHGEIDTLAGRIASIRVWTYVSHRSGWLKQGDHWAHVTRGVEDKLSDALHERLTQRFVDRRTAVLMRALKKRDDLSVSIDEDSQKVAVEGHEIGELQGFAFRVEAGAARDDQKMLKAAADAALKGEILRRAKLFANVGVKTQEIDFSEGLDKPRLLSEGAPFAIITDPGATLAPRVKLTENTLLEGEAADIVRDAAQTWLDARVAEKLEPLLKLAGELNGDVEPPEGAVALSGTVRGVAYRLLENFGVLKRSEVAAELRDIDQEQRKALRRFGIRIGATSLYIPFVLKPHATELRLMLWAMKQGEDATLPTLPTPGMVWVDRNPDAPEAFYNLAGFVDCGPKAVRMDMLERLADAVRPLGQGRDWFEVTPEIMGLVGLSGADFGAVMRSIGYENEVRQVPATKAAVATETPDGTADAVSADPAGETPAAEAPKAEAETAAAEPAPESAATESKNAEATVESTDDSSPRDTTVPDAAPEASSPEEAGTSGEASTSEEASTSAAATTEDAAELVDRHFFRWAPKRQGRSGGRPGGRAGGRPTGRRGEGQGRGRDGGKPKTDGRGARGDNANSGTKRSAAPKREKQADPDSPFAALAGLKDQLRKK